MNSTCFGAILLAVLPILAEMWVMGFVVSLVCKAFFGGE